MPSKSTHLIVLLIALTLLISACAKRGKVQSFPQEAPPPLCLAIEGTFEMDGLKGRLTIQTREPDLLRIELYGAMNILLMAVAGDGNRCELYRDGRVKGCRWERSIMISPAEFVSIISGDYGRLVGWENNKDGDGRVVKLIRSIDGLSPVSITIEEYREIEQRVVPASLLIESRGKRLRLRFKSITEAPIGLDNFRLSLKKAVLPPSRPA